MLVTPCAPHARPRHPNPPPRVRPKNPNKIMGGGLCVEGGEGAWRRGWEGRRGAAVRSREGLWAVMLCVAVMQRPITGL